MPHSMSVIDSILSDYINSGIVSVDSKACFVNDGSNDKTWSIISDAVNKNKRFCGISLSKNFGHQSALLAGLFNTEADIYVTIDVDLQDNPDTIREMIRLYKDEGCEVVYGVRNKRDTDTFLKKYTALAFYKLMFVFGVNLVFNHGDFRLMSKNAVNYLRDFKEKNLFLRAIVPLIGFKSGKVCFDRTERIAGETKYPLRKMIGFAWNGITSFSTFPLTMILLIGCILLLVGLVLLFVSFCCNGNTITIDRNIFLSVISIVSGIQIICLGIVAEYVGKVLVEVKQRPSFIVDKKINIV